MENKENQTYLASLTLWKDHSVNPRSLSLFENSAQWCNMQDEFFEGFNFKLIIFVLQKHFHTEQKPNNQKQQSHCL